jgi:hypothetical protein
MSAAGSPAAPDAPPTPPPVRPAAVLAFRAMASEHRSEAREALAIEEADAWFEYLEAVRAHAPTGRYDEVEPWAWARLTQRLRIVETERSRLHAAAA